MHSLGQTDRHRKCRARKTGKQQRTIEEQYGLRPIYRTQQDSRSLNGQKIVGLWRSGENLEAMFLVHGSCRAGPDGVAKIRKGRPSPFEERGIQVTCRGDGTGCLCVPESFSKHLSQLTEATFNKRIWDSQCQREREQWGPGLGPAVRRKRYDLRHRRLHLFASQQVPKQTLTRPPGPQLASRGPSLQKPGTCSCFNLSDCV